MGNGAAFLSYKHLIVSDSCAEYSKQFGVYGFIP